MESQKWSPQGNINVNYFILFYFYKMQLNSSATCEGCNVSTEFSNLMLEEHLQQMVCSRTVQLIDDVQSSRSSKSIVMVAAIFRTKTNKSFLKFKKKKSSHTQNLSLLSSVKWF